MKGKLYIIGMGPGDTDLVTRKAEHLLRNAGIIAYFAKRGEIGHARQIADLFLPNAVTELRFEYPITTEISHHDPLYKQIINNFYEDCSIQLSEQLNKNLSPLLLCEGDPLFYGSSIHLFDRLQNTFDIEIVPGISAMSGCWNEAQLPIVRNQQTLSVLPATLSKEQLLLKLQTCDATVIMKIGSNLEKIRTVLKAVNLFDRALYVERGTQKQQRILPLSLLKDEYVPYFSLILIAGQ